MGLFSRHAQPDAGANFEAKDDVTHVLMWVPGYLTEDGYEGWELQPFPNFESGNLLDDQPGTDASRDADPSLLATWVAGELGYPVTLTAYEQEIRTGRRASRRNAEPIYYVQPAEGEF